VPLAALGIDSQSHRSTTGIERGPLT
jgi:hypothetical protein